jgi:hypothetical protein
LLRIDDHFFAYRNNLITKIKINRLGCYKHKRTRLHNAFSFYVSKNRFFKTKNMLYKDNLLLLSFRRKTFLYIKPFVVRNLFFSKLVQGKVLKWLATIW